MSPLQPVALFGLEVPPGDILVPISQNFPATVSFSVSLFSQLQCYTNATQYNSFCRIVQTSLEVPSS